MYIYKYLCVYIYFFQSGGFTEAFEWSRESGKKQHFQQLNMRHDCNCCYKYINFLAFNAASACWSRQEMMDAGASWALIISADSPWAYLVFLFIYFWRWVDPDETRQGVDMLMRVIFSLRGSNLLKVWTGGLVFDWLVTTIRLSSMTVWDSRLFLINKLPQTLSLTLTTEHQQFCCFCKTVVFKRFLFLGSWPGIGKMSVRCLNMLPTFPF